MKIIPIKNVVQYTDVTHLSAVGNQLLSPEAPVIVIFTKHMAELSDQDSTALKSCPALTVVAGKDLSGISQTVLSKFDVRITEQCSTLLKTDSDNQSWERLCGENAAYRYAQGEFISKFFFTILKGEQTFYEKAVQYLTYLTKEKSEVQLYSLAACFRAARDGEPEAVFTQESLQFYYLMKEKAKEASHETNA